MPHKPAAKRPKRVKRTQDEADEIAELASQINSSVGAAGPDVEDWTLARDFAGLPISSYTKEALQEHKFVDAHSNTKSRPAARTARQRRAGGC